MSRDLKRVGFLLEDFTVPSAGQQLLDRFLVGYSRDGMLRRMDGLELSVYIANGSGGPELERRLKDHGLLLAVAPEVVIIGADAVIVAWASPAKPARTELLNMALKVLPTGAGCFVHGLLDSTLAGARRLSTEAARRGIILASGTPWSVTWRLPDVDLQRGTVLTDALIVVQGSFPEAELTALDGLLPIIQHRKGGERGVRGFTQLKGQEVWDAGRKGLWSESLLAAAISRSDTPQGDPTKDGRTQDLFGLGLIPKLARDPRAWILDHGSLRSTILVLNGVTADVTFAVRSRTGSVTSAQLYRPPPPRDAFFDRLAGVVEDFCRASTEPWPIARSLLTAGLMEAIRGAADNGHREVRTSQLRF